MSIWLHWRWNHYLSKKWTVTRKPECLRLDTGSSPCRDPGEVNFAERSQSFLPVNDNSQPGQSLPYSTNSELRYTCQSGYTGGGTITCQRSGQWTRKPECLRLDTGSIPCRDPGEVDFAERSGSFLPVNDNSQPEQDLPYFTNTELKYTCDPCYIGGGIITCQSNGQWTSKPECTRLDTNVVCRAPALVDGYLTPSFDKYECGVKIIFTCDQGSTQTVGACGPDGQFIGGISSCVKNESPDKETKIATESIRNGTQTKTDSPTIGSPGQETKPESDVTNKGPSGSIYVIAGGAAGGVVLMILVGLTIFCIKRSKKNNPSYADTAKTQNTVTDGGYIGIVTEGLNGTPGNGLNKQADSEASEAGYAQPVSGSPGYGLYAEAEPISDRDTSQQTVTDNEVFSNLAYEDDYQEIKDALPKEDPYADVDEDPYEN